MANLCGGGWLANGTVWGFRGSGQPDPLDAFNPDNLGVVDHELNRAIA